MMMRVVDNDDLGEVREVGEVEGSREKGKQVLGAWAQGTPSVKYSVLKVR